MSFTVKNGRMKKPRRAAKLSHPSPRPPFARQPSSGDEAKASVFGIRSVSNDQTIAITPDPAHPLAFAVVVSDARSESRHQVTMSSEDAARWAKLGADPVLLVEAAMRFLLDREPKEAILSAFDIRVIARYFPEFENELPKNLARIRAEAKGSG